MPLFGSPAEASDSGYAVSNFRKVHKRFGTLAVLKERNIVCSISVIAKQSMTWYAFKENGMKPTRLFDHWSEQYFEVAMDNEYFVLPPYSFFILEPK